MLATIMVAMAACLILAKVYEKEVTQFAIKKINENLTAKIEVKDVNFSLLERFPYASLKFEDVLLKDSIKANDTIFYANKLFLKLSIIDLIKENYTVKKIEVNRSVMYLSVDKNGRENYLFWKKRAKDSVKSALTFSLEDVDLIDVNLTYTNAISEQDYSFSIDKLALEGNFSESEFVLNGKGNLLVNHFMSNQVDYLPERKVNLEANLAVNTKDKSYRFNSGELTIEGLSFDVGGFYEDKANTVDVYFNGKNLHLISALELLPGVYKKSLVDYRSSGNLTFKANVKGRISKTQTPDVVAGFTVKSGAVTEKKSDISLNNLSLDGNYSSIKNQIDIHAFSGTFENGSFSGDLNLNLTKTPLLNINAKGSLNLNTLYRFLSSTSLNNLNGNIAFNGKLTSKLQENKLAIQSSEGAVDFSKVNFSFKNESLKYQNLSGHFELRKNHVFVHNLTGKLDDAEVEMHGYWRNFLPYILNEDERLIIEAETHVNKADIKALMAHFNKGSENADSSAHKNISLNLRLSANELIYGKLIAKHVRGTVQINDNDIRYKNLYFETAQGTISSSGYLHYLPDKHYLFTLSANAQNVDASEFFQQLDDFGQNYLTHKNLKGRVSTNMEMKMKLTPNFDIVPSTLVSVADFNVKNGELINVSSLNYVAEYLANNWKIKPFINEDLLLEKTKHIRFSELNSQISIQNEQISIPQTAIYSDLININLEGSHGFNDTVDYHFNFRLRDALIKENNKAKFEEEFSGFEVDDQTGMRLFIKMTGNLFDPDISLDLKSKKEQRKEKIVEEKSTVKSILKDEFGLFKTDTTLQSTEKEKENVKFVVDWDEFEQQSDSVQTNDTTSTDKKKAEKEARKKERMQKFLQKIGAEENKEEEVEFKIDQ